VADHFSVPSAETRGAFNSGALILATCNRPTMCSFQPRDFCGRRADQPSADSFHDLVAQVAVERQTLEAD